MWYFLASNNALTTLRGDRAISLDVQTIAFDTIPNVLGAHTGKGNDHRKALLGFVNVDRRLPRFAGTMAHLEAKELLAQALRLIHNPKSFEPHP
jgi:hypothetical protein